jgi:hypothetical protein
VKTDERRRLLQKKSENGNIWTIFTNFCQIDEFLQIRFIYSYCKKIAKIAISGRFRQIYVKIDEFLQFRFISCVVCFVWRVHLSVVVFLMLIVECGFSSAICSMSGVTVDGCCRFLVVNSWLQGVLAVDCWCRLSLTFSIVGAQL